MKQIKMPRCAKSLALCLMLCLGAWLPAAVESEISPKTDKPAREHAPKSIRISTVELAANPERFVGKDVVVGAKVEKTFGEHWFAVDEDESIPGPILLVLVLHPAGTATAGQKVIIAGRVQKFAEVRGEVLRGHLGLNPQIEAEFQSRPLIVADSITLPSGEDLVAQPEPEEKLTPEQKKALDMLKVRADLKNIQQQVRPSIRVKKQAQEDSSPKADAKISPEAQTLLEQLRDAYAALQGADMSGDVQARVELSGKEQKMQHHFTSSFKAPNRFRHELEDGLIIGSTGEKTYIFQKSANAFFQQKAPNGKVPIEELPSPIPQLLQTQNPSLLFAIIKDPVPGVTEHMREIAKIQDSTLQGGAFPTLLLTPVDGQSKVTLVMDPQTHLLRRLEIEISPQALKNGHSDNGLEYVKAEIDYTSIKPRADFDQNHFAWSPPEGAKDLAAEKEKTSAKNLIGKPAPDFTLDTSDGESVSLSDLKGEVVVLDFWATWCPPCVRSLPELDQIYQQKSGEGVKVFAVNLKENEQQVQSFLRTRGLSLPVLMDREGEVALLFGVHAIPQTVIIGKDGEVRKVFVGAGTDTPDQIRAEIEAAMGQTAELSRD